MAVFAAMTGSASRDGRVHYIDGYAGPGRYEPEKDIHLVVPVRRCWRPAQQHAWPTGTGTLHCTFIERDANHVADWVDIGGYVAQLLRRRASRRWESLGADPR